jgi:hypothetical protein
MAQKTRFWLSYDLGLRGNYEDLYEWLDRHEARECGDSLATFVSSKTRMQLREEILMVPGMKVARLYLIGLNDSGGFIAGKRKVAPWTGYATSVESSEVER